VLVGDRQATTPETDSTPLLEHVDDAIAYLDERLAESEERLVTNLRLGRMLQALDAAARRIAGLEANCADWECRFLICLDERNRAEARVAELEGLLDAALEGIDVKSPHRRPTIGRATGRAMPDCPVAVTPAGLTVSYLPAEGLSLRDLLRTARAS
jgi:hypothetical protein